VYAAGLKKREALSVANIVLAHGFLGFDKLLPGPLPSPHYFNGVAAHLTNQGHNVIEAKVDAIGSVKDRGDQLAEILRNAMPGEPLHIIAHSMGGLDARHAITNRKDIVTRVKTLVTIGTPHLGSEVADAVVSKVGPLFKAIPTVLLNQLQNSAGAIPDLTTEKSIPRDKITVDQEGIRYIEIAGNASKAGNESLLFRTSAEIGHLTQDVNDGMVTKTSALRNKPGQQPDWPVDHAGEIGWSLGSPLPIEPLLHTPFLLTSAAKEHLARYEMIATLFTVSAAHA
jgi:triacylglycerol lipase